MARFVAAFLVCLALVCAYATAQSCQLVPSQNNISVEDWTDLGTEFVDYIYCHPANWQFPQPNTAEQTTNTCGSTHLVSDFTITSSDIIRGTLTGIRIASPDDDYIGFSIGQDCGTAPNPASCSGDSVNLTWGAGFSNANPGLCASRRNFPGIGVCPYNGDPGKLDSASACANPNTNVLPPIGPGLQGSPIYADPPAFHANQLGGVSGVDTQLDRFCDPHGLPLGWVLDRDYDFIIQYTPTRLRVFVDFVKVFDYDVVTTGEPQMSSQGRISLVNSSQGNVRYGDMQILDTGTDQCNGDPWTYGLPVSVCPSGTTQLDVDWGDGTSDTYPVFTTGIVQLSHVFAATSNGFYTVTVELNDGTGVQDTYSLLAFILEAPVSEILPQINGECGFPMRCDANNGGVFVNLLDGGNPDYSLTWSGPGVGTFTVTSPSECAGETGCARTITGLTPGTYNLDVVDNNGCVAARDSTVVFSSRTTITSMSSPACGEIEVEASSTANCSGSSLSYFWSTTNGTPPANPNSQNQSGLGPGTYTVVVTDSNGCTDTDSFDLSFGLSNVVAGDIYFMYVDREVEWAGFPPGTQGTVALDCPSSNTVIFTGDLGSTTSAILNPNKIVPESNCSITITGAVDPTGCYNEVSPVHVCTHPNVGAVECTTQLYVE